MKKLLTVLLLIATVFSLSSCTIAIELISAAAGLASAAMNPPDYEAEDTEFTFHKLTMTVPKSFTVSESYDNYVTLAAPAGTLIWIDLYHKNELDIGGGLELAAYAEDLRSSVSDGIYYRDVSEVVTEDDLTYVVYTTNEIISYKCFASLYMNDDDVYVVTYMREISTYDTYYPYFNAWARTVKVGASGTTI